MPTRAQTTVLKVGITPVSHVAAGHSARLTAFQEYREGSGAADAVSAAPATSGLHHEAVTARWSVSDTELASISEDGTLTALKPGRVTIKSSWENDEASSTIEVVNNLPVNSLPQTSSRGTQCVPQAIALSLEADRAIHFQLSFAEDGCRDVELTATAPDQPLPWAFDTDGSHLELTGVLGQSSTAPRGFPSAAKSHLRSGQAARARFPSPWRQDSAAHRRLDGRRRRRCAAKEGRGGGRALH